MIIFMCNNESLRDLRGRLVGTAVGLHILPEDRNVSPGLIDSGDDDEESGGTEELKQSRSTQNK